MCLWGSRTLAMAVAFLTGAVLKWLWISASFLSEIQIRLGIYKWIALQIMEGISCLLSNTQPGLTTVLLKSSSIKASHRTLWSNLMQSSSPLPLPSIFPGFLLNAGGATLRFLFSEDTYEDSTPVNNLFSSQKDCHWDGCYKTAPSTDHRTKLHHHSLSEKSCLPMSRGLHVLHSEWTGMRAEVMSLKSQSLMHQNHDLNPVFSPNTYPSLCTKGATLSPLGAGLDRHRFLSPL